jgi:hypothetical protein
MPRVCSAVCLSVLGRVRDPQDRLDKRAPARRRWRTRAPRYGTACPRSPCPRRHSRSTRWLTASAAAAREPPSAQRCSPIRRGRILRWPLQRRWSCFRSPRLTTRWSPPDTSSSKTWCRPAASTRLWRFAGPGRRPSQLRVRGRSRLLSHAVADRLRSCQPRRDGEYRVACQAPSANRMPHTRKDMSHR